MRKVLGWFWPSDRPSPGASTFLMIAMGQQAYYGLNSKQHNAAIIFKSWWPIN